MPAFISTTYMGSPGFTILVLGYGDEYAWILNLDLALGFEKRITQTNKDV